ncbi:MAG TPA: hypothetical protein V6C85_02755 [Allocoleopsis sp.]
MLNFKANRRSRSYYRTRSPWFLRITDMNCNLERINQPRSLPTQ